MSRIVKLICARQIAAVDGQGGTGSDALQRISNGMHALLGLRSADRVRDGLRRDAFAALLDFCTAPNDHSMAAFRKEFGLPRSDKPLKMHLNQHIVAPYSAGPETNRAAQRAFLDLLSRNTQIPRPRLVPIHTLRYELTILDGVRQVAVTFGDDDDTTVWRLECPFGDSNAARERPFNFGFTWRWGPQTRDLKFDGVLRPAGGAQAVRTGPDEAGLVTLNSQKWEVTIAFDPRGVQPLIPEDVAMRLR